MPKTTPSMILASTSKTDSVGMLEVCYAKFTKQMTRNKTESLPCFHFRNFPRLFSWIFPYGLFKLHGWNSTWDYIKILIRHYIYTTWNIYILYIYIMGYCQMQAPQLRTWRESEEHGYASRQMEHALFHTKSHSKLVSDSLYTCSNNLKQRRHFAISILLQKGTSA